MINIENDFKFINFWEQFDIKNYHYMQKYINFIILRLDRGKLSVYTEKHHIVPRSYIENDFTIILTAREHYVSHILLAKALEGKMSNALQRMTLKGGLKYNVSSRDYERSRLLMVKILSPRMKLRWRLGLISGHSQTEETRLKMSDKAKKSWRKGRMTKYKFIKKTDLPTLPYEHQNMFNQIHKCITIITELERRKKLSKAFSGELNPRYGEHCKYMHKDGVNKMVKLEDIDTYLNLGFEFGMITSDRSGANNANFGHKWNNKQRKNLSEKRKIDSKQNPRVWMHKGTNTRMILKAEVNEYKKQGYLLGRGKHCFGR